MQLQFLTAVQVSWTPYLHRSKVAVVNDANGSVFSTKQIRAQWICLWKGKTTGNLYGQLPSAAFRQSIHPWSAKCATVFSACSGCHVLNMLQDLSLCKFLLIFFCCIECACKSSKFEKSTGFVAFGGGSWSGKRVRYSNTQNESKWNVQIMQAGPQGPTEAPWFKLIGP